MVKCEGRGRNRKIVVGRKRKAIVWNDGRKFVCTIVIDLFDTLSLPVIDLIYYGFSSRPNSSVWFTKESIYISKMERRIVKYVCASDFAYVYMLRMYICA